MGGSEDSNLFRRYAIVRSADQRAAVEMLEQARAETNTDQGTDTSGVPKGFPNDGHGKGLFEHPSS
jgi:hypothetical protein